MKPYQVTLSIADQLLFNFIDDNGKETTIIGDSNPDIIIRNHFKGPIPTDGEVEAAIYDVEKAIFEAERVLRPIQDKELILDYAFAKEAFPEIKDGIVTYKYLEQLNYRYADYIAGMPESFVRLKFSMKNYGLILFLREIMHHFHFDKMRFEDN